jgi:hypothetical protein
MRIIETVVKTYEEWDDATKSIILDKHRDINVDHDDWCNFELENWADKLLEKGYDVREQCTRKDGRKYNKIGIAYSGFWSQGDGASITGEVDVEKWILANNYSKYKRLYKLIRNGNIDAPATIKRDRWHNYVHWNTTTLYIDWRYNTDYISKSLDNIELLMDQLDQEITTDMQDINKEIYRDLENTYDSLCSDESVADTLIANAYEFDENGKMC